MSNEPTEATTTVSLIGRSYWPTDNSYSICLNDDKKYHLAGHSFSPPKQQEEVTIISEPFEGIVTMDRLFGGGRKTHSFILVRCAAGLMHKVLYHALNLQPTAIRRERFYTA